MSGITPFARFLPVSSNVNAPIGISVEPKFPGQVLSVTYSFLDQASKFNPLANPIQSRIAIIAGRFGDALTNFSIAYDLNSSRVLLDHAINDVGPTSILIPPDAQDGVPIETDGVTVLLAAPVVTGVTGTLFVGKLLVASRGLVTQTAGHDRRVNPGANQTQSTSSGGSSSSSSSSSGGGSTGGGTVGGGGVSRIRPL